jgi:hypothetical protein
MQIIRAMLLRRDFFPAQKLKILRNGDKKQLPSTYSPILQTIEAKFVV